MSKIRFINLIRVIGLILVLCYHLFERFLPGGFLGVDIFFVVSGYLITSIIILEFERNNQFRFMPYIKRRLNRIFPPLLFMLISTLPFIKLLPDDFTANISKQIAAVLGFATNYFEIATGGSYEARLLPHLYIHTWTLSLEIVYYVFWGGFCALIIRSFLKLKEDVRTNVIKGILVCSALIISIFSYINMQYLFSNNLNKSVAYFASQSHIFPFFIGSIFGILFGFKISEKTSLKLRNKAKFFRIFSVVILVVSLCSIVYLAHELKFGTNFVYRHGFLLVDILAGLAIVQARILHEVVSESYIESSAISHFANLSYAIYLFHWPFHIIFSNSLPEIATISTLLFTYVFSLVVYYLVDPMFYAGSNKENKKSDRYCINMRILCIAIIGCIFIDAGILINQKEITSLEEEQMVGSIVQNIDKIENLKVGINSINEHPVLEKDGIYNFDKLDINSEEKQKVSLTPIPEEKKIIEPVIKPKEDESKSQEPSSPPSVPEVKEPEEKTDNVPVKEEVVPIVVDNDGVVDNDNTVDSGSKVDNDNVVDNGGVENETTPLEDAIEKPKSITVIGDSVALGARKNIIDTIPNTYADTKQNRNLQQGYSVIMELQKQGILGEYVVVALGTNGCNTWKTYIDKIITDIEPGHRLLFVTPYDGRWNPSWISYKTTEYLRSIKDTYSFVTIVDWASEVSKDPSLVGADKIHIGGYVKGIKAFTNKIIEGIDEASKKSAK